jgi:hypothetical protein
MPMTMPLPRWLTTVLCIIGKRHLEQLQRRGNTVYLGCDHCGSWRGGWKVDDRRYRPERDRRHDDRRTPFGAHDRRSYDRRFTERRIEMPADPDTVEGGSP